MKHIYNSALKLIENRIQKCAKAIQKGTDEFTVTYWNMELAKACYTRVRIEKRLKSSHNVVFVDFVSKRRAA